MEEREMTQVLIVEDEVAVRRSLSGKLRRDPGGPYAIREAGHAEEAYEMIKDALPDIVLLDMRMPGMGGMKFLEILNDQFPQIKVIILSGYSDFEYVKQALVCGATDYLLKPVIKEELFKAISKTVNAIHEERQKLKQEMKHNQLLNQSIPLLKNNLLNALLKREYLNAEELIKKINILNIPLNFNHYALAIVNIIDFDKIKLFYKRDVLLVFFALENVLSESMKPLDHFIGFKSALKENEYIYILGFNESEGMRERLEYVFRNAIENINKYNKIHINVSIGRAFESIWDLHHIYTQTSYIWQEKHDHTDSSILFFEDVAAAQDQPSMDLWVRELTGDMFDFIQNHDMKSIIGKVNRMFQALENEKVSKQLLPSAYRRLAAAIYKAVDEQAQNLQQINDKLFFIVPAFNELMSKYGNPEDIKYGILKVLSDFKESIAKVNHSDGKQIVHQAKEYIDKFFYENITLELLSEKFYINRTYLSELFKQETGSTFKRYLNHIRVEKAKQLLADGRMKTVEVALLVGFQDSLYFSNVFKKYTGCSIKEFKDGRG